jgi:hypothetical protein
MTAKIAVTYGSATGTGRALAPGRRRGRRPSRGLPGRVSGGPARRMP